MRGTVTQPSNSELLGAPGKTTAQVAFCLLLMALLLYNPFFTVLSISQDLSIQHILSYRATVAGSELRRCTFDAGEQLIPALRAVFSHAALFTPRTEIARVRPSDSPLFVQQTPCDSIRFRPPPSA